MEEYQFDIKINYSNNNRNNYMILNICSINRIE